ncbi:MAG: acyl-CoA dehydrogenase family protein, partial [Dehalococcoidia bacterium]
MPDLHEWLRRVESLRPLVETHAAECDRMRRLPQPVADGIVANRLCRPWIPRQFDGEELDLLDSLRVFEAAARVDGAFGWAVTIGVGGALFAPLLREATAREIYTPADALIAGSGTPSGEAAVEPGGYRVRGRWKYASGAHQATWFTASCRVTQDGSPVLDANGEPLVRAVAVPRDAVRIHETWDTLGMRGTGSHDIEMDCFVPEAHTFDAFGEPSLPGPLYRFPFLSTAEASFASVALGVGAHFLELFGELAATKQTRDGVVLGSHAVVATAIAEATVALESARLAFFAAVERAWATTTAGEAVSADQADAVRHTAVFASQTAVGVSDRLYAFAGMSPLAMWSALGRAWRDLHTVSQHVLLSPL